MVQMKERCFGIAFRAGIFFISHMVQMKGKEKKTKKSKILNFISHMVQMKD